MPRILAIDFGTKRTGRRYLMKMIATGLTTVDTAKALDYLKEYIQKEAVELFVVGVPKPERDRCRKSTPAINAFIKQLKLHFSTTPIERIDERFT